jgi:hypothetical protein
VVTEAAYLVRGAVTRAEASFRVKFQLVRAADGTAIATEENQCEVADCSVAELARRSARELVRQTLGRVETSAAQAPAAVAATAEAPRPLWPALLIGAGAATAGAGVVLWTLHGDCSGDRCARLYDTFWGGLAVVGVGVAAATVGVVYLVRGPGEARVAIGIGPSGLTASGRF